MSDPTLKYPRDALEDWRQEGRGPPPPEGGHFGDLIDTLFFASLAREEGHPALARIVYHEDGVQGLERTREQADFHSPQEPALAWTVIPFHPILLTVDALVKLTPAADVERTAIIVGPHNDQLHILGLARRSKSTDGGNVWVFSAPEPGFIVLHRAGEEVFRYERGKRLSPKQKFSLWEILHTDGLVRKTLETVCQNLVRTLTEASSFPNFPWMDSGVSPLLFDLINTMVSTRHGGLIAILAKEPSTAPKLSYSLSPHLSLHSELFRQAKRAQTRAVDLALNRLPDDHSNHEEEMAADEEARTAKEALDSLIANIGQLTALDNALLLGPDLKVIGAGYAVPTEADTPTVHVAQDLQGTPGGEYHINQHGSRHRAAASFAFKNPGGLVFLVSHDGPLRCLIRPSEEKPVLLWNLRLFEI
ncbi:putative sensor domain DACNV-containing protein [Archangium lansingense]|uniref:putative sensor domain DACNV-containing protein n=1 Tax=Archangium lansingense TaxID=2995310 RepID=UPI003B7CDFE3